MEPERSLACSQEQATGPYMNYINPAHNFPSCSLKSILILSYHLRLGLPSGLIPSGFATKIF